MTSFCGKPLARGNSKLHNIFGVIRCTNGLAQIASEGKGRKAGVSWGMTSNPASGRARTCDNLHVKNAKGRPEREH